MILVQLNKQECRVLGNPMFLEQKGYGFKEKKDHFLTIYETAFLLEKKKISLEEKGKQITFDDLTEKKFFDPTIYCAFKDMRSKGYVVGSGLKYGFQFRVYQKGILPSEDHALWLVEVFSESEKLKIKDFLAKNRVSHSARKRMLFAIVDNEKQVTYIEHSWKRL